MFDPDIVRRNFPEIADGLVYLDNAASTLKPISVVEEMKSFSLHEYANVHRGTYKLSIEASAKYDKAREKVARFINSEPNEVVFTYNSTDSLRRVALILLGNRVVSKGDEILVTEAEHHSNILPWRGLARLSGASLRILPVDSEGVPRWDMIDDYLTEKTKVFAFGHVSNVTGSIAPVNNVARKAKERGVIVVLDSAQGAPHLSINVKDMNVDFLAFSGHKMLGPTGIGVLWVNRELSEKLEPVFGGGGSIIDVYRDKNDISVEWEESPLKWEPGTPPIIEAIGLSKAVEYLENIGMHEITRYEEELTKLLFDLLEDSIRNKIRVLGPLDPKRRLGIVSFTVDGYSVNSVALYLSRKGIAVRTGKHCAHPLHYALKADKGSVRASLYLYNTRDEVERFIEALRSLVT
ncbi:MAG: cysteine desulfurase [Desulfurococcales archaeon]|nr:cysteine desulfurase [Desulfurococcales archaeon]